MCSKLSNFNYKSQIESHQQPLVLYVDWHQFYTDVTTEVTSRRMECIRFNLDYTSQMPADALQKFHFLNKSEIHGVQNQ